MIRFGPAIGHHCAAALQRQWSETDGLGGLASSTILGLNTQCKRRRSYAHDIATPLA